MNSVLIQGLDISYAELESFNKENTYDINLSTLESKKLFDSGTIFVFISLAQHLGYSTIYDIFKCTFLYIFSKLSSFDKKKTKIEVTCNGQRASIIINFPLTESQKDKIIDAMIGKLTNL